MQFKAKNDFLHLEEYEGDNRTATGLKKVSEKRGPSVMKVLSVGSEAGSEYKEGDLVCVDKLNCVEMPHNGVKYYFARKQFIYAKKEE